MSSQERYLYLPNELYWFFGAFRSACTRMSRSWSSRSFSGFAMS